MEALKKLAKHTDLLAAAAVVLVVVMMIVPLPPFLVDFFITLNICGALAILVSTMYLSRALDFSSFPSLLLLTTLFRLAINVSVTRLVLLHGDAGHVVKAFGQFVVGGNIVVGLVVFLILVVIQFVVITNGAGRVAEVAARFTLDAMPGKQMSIDADLNAGLIDEASARNRRRAIAQEADFYGAMDGASKFVRGDAIAGIVITFINILGGLYVGMVEHGQPIMRCLDVYTKLTIGDGLVSQVPAFIVSLGAGLIVTRTSSRRDLGDEMLGQIFSNPKPLIVAGAFLVLMSISGMPKLPSLVLGSCCGGLAFVLTRNQKQVARVK